MKGKSNWANYATVSIATFLKHLSLVIIQFIFQLIRRGSIVIIIIIINFIIIAVRKVQLAVCLLTYGQKQISSFNSSSQTFVVRIEIIFVNEFNFGFHYSLMHWTPSYSRHLFQAIDPNIYHPILFEVLLRFLKRLSNTLQRYCTLIRIGKWHVAWLERFGTHRHGFLNF